MRQIGQIKQLQVQRAALKQGKKPYRYYDPSPLLVVEKLLLTHEGVIGVTSENPEIIDVHNASHSESRNRDINGISFGFTSHYQSMRQKFGMHLTDGCAGENILVETEEMFTLETLGKHVAIQSREGNISIHLEDLRVAAPCVEFSHFVLNELMPAPAEVLRETLIFLDHGRRGFYATTSGKEPCALCVGDKLFVEV